MKTRFVFAFALISSCLPGIVAAQDVTHAQGNALAREIILPGDAVDLDSLIWEKRTLAVFADTPNDPRFIQQMNFITDGLEDLDERDVIILTDSMRDSDSALRQKLRPRGFMLVLIGKDGTVYLRKPLPWDVREISRTIDKMPLRQQEVRDRRGAS